MSAQPESQALNTSEDDYLRMIQRFDRLWAAANAGHEQAEMQRLLQQIEQYEKYRDSSEDTGNKVRL